MRLRQSKGINHYQLFECQIDAKLLLEVLQANLINKVDHLLKSVGCLSEVIGVVTVQVSKT